jgi:hypothetical protein
MPGNYAEAHRRGLMWWPVNQECVGCIHKERMQIEDLQRLGILTEKTIDPDDEPLAYHASKCNLKLVLRDGDYSCLSRNSPH